MPKRLNSDDEGDDYECSAVSWVAWAKEWMTVSHFRIIILCHFFLGCQTRWWWWLRLYYDVLCRALRGLCFTTVLTIKQRNISRAVVVEGVRRRRRRKSQGHKKGVCCSWKSPRHTILNLYGALIVSYLEWPFHNLMVIRSILNDFIFMQKGV